MSARSNFQHAFDDLINRLATECVLAQAGSDGGLVPAYSLLGDLRELCATSEPLRQPVAAAHAALEALLDAARPFDEPTLAWIRHLVSWLPHASQSVQAGESAPAFDPRGAPLVAAIESATPAATDDQLLELDLAQNRELLGEFHSEAVEHLQQIEAALLVLDQQPGDREALAAMFRSFHTIKGNAGFLGLRPMHLLAHEVESLLDLARNDQLRLTQPIISEILRSRDALHTLTQQIAAALDRGQLPAEVVHISNLIDAVRALAAAGNGSISELSLASEVARASCPCHGMGFEPMSAARSAVHGRDARATWRQLGDVPAGNGSKAGNTPAVPSGAAPDSPPEADPAEPGPPAASARDGRATSRAPGAATVRVSTGKLDSLMDVVGELVIVQSQLAETAREAAHTPLQRSLTQLGRITKELQHTALSLRMIPIKSTFQKMERLARDLARQCGKQVVFTTSGDETELDRTVVEQIGDPLVHMVRNALDHGVEPGPERVAAGKPEAGVLHLKAYHQGSSIVIELQDDGRGLDPDRIYRKALEKGVIPADAQLSREELHALIFAPGFSTAEKLTGVSGRGVGMDVVKRNIEKLRGNVEIASELGRGSVFKIKLPLTMAIIDGLVVRVGEDRFILPSTSVQMALRPAREHVSTLQGEGEVLDLRGKLVPIHRLDRRFGIPGDAAQPWDGIVVIVETAGKISALLVDEMVTKQEVVIKSLGAFMRNVRGVSGGAILGDGNIALILDPSTLLSAA
jgi:two-component system, chemotaxis family, sensor kinase CheA